MNTKLLNNDKDYSEITEGFSDIFKFEDKKDRLELDAKILSAKFLSEIQNKADSMGISSRKELAKLIGTSASYLTQLFRGNKVLNLMMLAKIQNALNIEFNISVKDTTSFNDELNIAEYIDKWYYNNKTKDYIKLIRRKNPKRKNINFKNNYSSLSQFKYYENR